MPKIRVSFEAEIDDLASYYPDDPPGATQANIAAFVRGLQERALDQRINAMLAGDYATRMALLKRYSDDVKLAERIMKALVVEIVP